MTGGIDKWDGMGMGKGMGSRSVGGAWSWGGGRLGGPDEPRELLACWRCM